MVETEIKKEVVKKLTRKQVFTLSAMSILLFFILGLVICLYAPTQLVNFFSIW